MRTVGSVTCVGCGWHVGVGSDIVGNVHDDPGSIARTVAAHLEGCPKRFKGHPAFGFEARWTTTSLYDGPPQDGTTTPTLREHVEFGWADSRWGFPFNLDAVAA